jgi:hypothetical protein
MPVSQAVAAIIDGRFTYSVNRARSYLISSTRGMYVCMCDVVCMYISCTGVKIPAFRYLPKTHDLGPDSGRSAPSHVNVII